MGGDWCLQVSPLLQCNGSCSSGWWCHVKHPHHQLSSALLETSQVLPGLNQACVGCRALFKEKEASAGEENYKLSAGCCWNVTPENPQGGRVEKLTCHQSIPRHSRHQKPSHLDTSRKETIHHYYVPEADLHDWKQSDAEPILGRLCQHLPLSRWISLVGTHDWKWEARFSTEFMSQQ